MRCERCNGRCHSSDWCYFMAERVCPSCFWIANGVKPPKRVRKARRVPTGVVVVFRFALWFGGVIVAGRSFDRLNEGTGTGWLGLVVGLVFAFSAVVWPSSSQEKRG